jgi:dTDP-4-dehydrorhamnose 3,5-epimerase
MDVGQNTVVPGFHNHNGVYIPPGVAHGFAALSDMTITYMVDGYYNDNDELGVAWDDPQINADWGIKHPILSRRDENNPKLSEIPDRLIPYFGLR